MNETSFCPHFVPDDCPAITQADLDWATFRVGRWLAPRKQRVTIKLDTGLIEYFKARASERACQTLINETLCCAVKAEVPETRLGRIAGAEVRGRR